MKVIDILRYINFPPLYTFVYIENEDEEDPIWEGKLNTLPWWIADLELPKTFHGEAPIDYRTSLGKEHDNQPGLVIVVKDTLSS